jgi:cytochrome c5
VTRPVLATAVALVSLALAGPAIRAHQATAPTRAATPAPALPPGTGVDVAKAKCIGCHEADLIVSQRLSQTGWDREIAKMERWGAKLGADERPVLLAYLTREFGVRPAVAHDAAAAASGETVFKNACLSCHGDDLSKQQRLTAAGWGREVDKMVRWGAKVSADEKPALVAYLTRTWGMP